MVVVVPSLLFESSHISQSLIFAWNAKGSSRNLDNFAATLSICNAKLVSSSRFTDAAADIFLTCKTSVGCTNDDFKSSTLSKQFNPKWISIWFVTTRKFLAVFDECNIAFNSLTVETSISSIMLSRFTLL